MPPSVFIKALWDQRRPIAAWSVGIAAIGLLYAVFFPTMVTPGLAEFIREFPPDILKAMGITDFVSAAGYVGSTTYGFIGQTLMIVFAAALGSRAIAGDEEAGRLDVLLAHPVERWRFVVERALAMVVALAVAGVVLAMALLAISGLAQLGPIGVARMFAASAQLVLLGAVFGSLALAVGALTGRRAWAAAAVAVIGVAGYFANTLGPSIDVLAWTPFLSPFHYYSRGQPLVNGLNVADAAVLCGAALALIVLAAVAFRRRDVAV